MSVVHQPKLRMISEARIWSVSLAQGRGSMRSRPCVWFVTVCKDQRETSMEFESLSGEEKISRVGQE
jgi:hypothetical protein